MRVHLRLIPLLCTTLLSAVYAQAQNESHIFKLPEAAVGQSYRVDIEAVLRDSYRLRIEAGSRNAILQWTLADGYMCPGLSLRTQGVIEGSPTRATDGDYSFVLRVVDVSASDGGLILKFALPVKPGKLRLTAIDGPRLVPTDVEPLRADYRSNGPNTSSSADSATASTTPAASTRTRSGKPDNVAGSIDFATPGVTDGGSENHFSEAKKTLIIKVTDANQSICLLNTVVLGSHERVISNSKSLVDYNDGAKQKLEVALAKDTNHIAITAYAKKNAEQTCAVDTDLNDLSPMNSVTYDITCDSGSCGKATKGDGTKGEGESLIDESVSAFSNMNTRALIGMEQAGASSAASEQNPIIDFFFNTPHGKTTDKNGKKVTPRFSIWGNVRLTSTPQQVSGFISSTSNFVGAVKADKINDIATSFDFRFGPEFQFNPDSKNTWSVIAGFGASSPLTEPTSAAPIFKIPTDLTNSQTLNFYNDYPEADARIDPKRKFIAFVRPERDRFLRQYFAGLRFKSYHYSGGERENRFPSMFDLTFGQNAAVTGGHLHKFVVNVEGSYQLPLKKALYIFGSANLKFGGDKFIKTPYVLDLADPKTTLTDPGIVTTTRQLNRDSYRLGFAVDLIELFRPPKDTKNK